jgi:hypothetical protein
MNDFSITCDYELNPVLREFLGAQLSAISSKDCTIGIGKQLTCSVYGELRLSAHDRYGETFFAILFASKGHESYAGNLYGIEVVGFAKGDRKEIFKQEILPARILNEFGSIKKIIGLGETRNDVVYVKGKEEIEVFFPANSVLPDTITIKKKTLEVIGFGLDTGKWLYIYSDGEGHFRIGLNEDTLPESLCQDPDYLVMGKNLQILAVFE